MYPVASGDEVDSGPGIGEGEADPEPPAFDPATQRAAASPVLPHALPALLDLDPVELASMRDSLCPRPPEDSRPAKRRTVDVWRPPTNAEASTQQVRHDLACHAMTWHVGVYGARCK